MTEREAHLISSESVTEGHPDKMCDRISDGVLDAVLDKDPTGRVACETMITTGMVVIAGEISTTQEINYGKLAREAIREIGYNDPSYGFDAENCAVLNAVDEQSPDIAMGVDTGGAGDQGMMFGYACRETPELMPLPIMLAHGLTRRLAEVRKSNELDFLRPDGKSQVTVEYTGERQPLRVHTVVISTQHDDVFEDKRELEEAIIDKVIHPAVPAELIDDQTIFHVNPTGRFVVGGPKGDCGLTGRKIIVDTYGGVGGHGGGAFSGKDPTKVDRSATYMARHIAKNLVAAGLADRLRVQLAYAIGVADPVSVHAEAYGTANIPEAEIERLIREHFPLTPLAIIEYLDLRRPIFKATAAYGHFGRPEFSWEGLGKVDELRAAAGITEAPVAAS